MSEIFPESPLTSLPEAVAAMGALPVPVGPQMPDFPPPPQTFEEKLRQDVARLQGLLSEAVRDAHRARSERDLIRERVSEPFGCTYCGVEKRSHGRRYIGGQGMHAWERPSDEQVKARMLARRVARSPLPAAPELEQLHNDLTGANLSLWEEEQAYRRLRTAMLAVQRDRRNLRARVAELEADLATANGTLDDVAEARRAEASCPCPPETPPAPHQVGCHFDGVPVSPPSERPVNGLTATFMPLASLRESLSREEPHDSPLHHPYLKGHDLDLPATGGAE